MKIPLGQRINPTMLCTTAYGHDPMIRLRAGWIFVDVCERNEDLHKLTLVQTCDDVLLYYILARRW